MIALREDVNHLKANDIVSRPSQSDARSAQGDTTVVPQSGLHDPNERKELQSLLEKGAVVLVTDSQEGFYSNLSGAQEEWSNETSDQPEAVAIEHFKWRESSH